MLRSRSVGRSLTTALLLPVLALGAAQPAVARRAESQPAWPTPSGRSAKLAVRANPAAPAAPRRMTTDNLTNPLGISGTNLAFGWTVNDSHRGAVQSAYQIVVATTAAKAGAHTADVWDSGKVLSDASLSVPYRGPAPRSATAYYWSVRTWNAAGLGSPWSATSSYETGLLNPGDWSGAQWIAGVNGHLYRTKFTVTKQVARARLYATAQGLYEMRIDGAQVGDAVLEPSWTDFRKHTGVRTYDVTTMIAPGANAIGMTLASGRNAVTPATSTWVPASGTPYAPPNGMAKLVITYTDGTTSVVATGSTWRTSAGPITSTLVGQGENYDARAEQVGWDGATYDDTGWAPVSTASISATADPAMEPPARIVETLHPVSVTSPRAGAFVFDFGVDISGWGLLSATEPAGTTASILYGEILDGAGDVTDSNLYGGPQRDTYVFKGAAGGEKRRGQFDYKGFRYAEITGLAAATASTLSAQVVRNDVASIGAFASSDASLNRIYQAQRQTRLNTLHGVPEDNPTREKRGWGADAMVTSDAALYDFDMASFYEKFLSDVRTGQGSDGSLWDVNPNNDINGLSHDAAWSSDLPMIAWRTYEYTGDVRILTQNYAAITAWLTWVDSQRDSSGLVGGSQGAINYGDWVTNEPAANRPSTQWLYTGFYYQDLVTAQRIATTLGNTADAAGFSTRANAVAATLNGALVGGSYGASQLANALPVAMGFVPAAARSAVVTRLVDLISNAATPGLITAGILGMQLIFQALSQNGHADLVYQYLQRTDQPSYLQMLNDGPGTIWEAWNDPSTTNDQPALGGAPGQWCYQQLAGIEPSLLAGQGGYKAITFAPHVDGTVASASGTIATPRGTVTSAWTLTGTSRLTLRVTVPANASGTVVVPRLNAAATTISESGTAVFANGASTGTTPGLFFVAADASTVTFRVGSGTYAFDVGTSAP